MESYLDTYLQLHTNEGRASLVCYAVTIPGLKVPLEHILRAYVTIMTLPEGLYGAELGFDDAGLLAEKAELPGRAIHAYLAAASLGDALRVAKKYNLEELLPLTA